MSDNTIAAETTNTMRAVDLFAAIGDVLPFAGTDDTLPMLTCIRVEAGGGRLVTVTTDRFTLGARRVDYDGEAFDAMIGGTDARNLQRMAKTLKRDAGHRTVTIALERREAGDVAALTFTFSTGEAITVPSADVTFPKWQQLIPTTDDVVPADNLARLSYNPGYLAKFAKVSSDANHQMVLWTRPGIEVKPLTITIGADFVGLIMPVRMPDGAGYARPAWLTTTTA